MYNIWSFLVELSSQVWNFLADHNPFMHILQAVADQTIKGFVVAVIAIVLTGLIGGIIAKRLKQPLILGYILAGVAAGALIQFCIGETGEVALSSLADIGVALLLFSMGLEFSWSDIKPIYKIAVWGSLAQVFFTLIAGSGLAFVLSRYWPALFSGPASWLLFGCAFVSTSTAVILKTLTSKGQTGKLSYKVMIGISIVQDLTVIPIMLLICQLEHLSAGVAQAVWPLCKGAFFIVVMMTIGYKYIPVLLRHVAKLESKELFLLAVTGIALGIGLIAEVAGTSFSFGAFIAGIVLSDSDYGKKALVELMPVRDLFTMLFFVSIGMMLDSTYLFRNFLLVFALVFLTSLLRTVFLSIITLKAGYKNVIPFAMFFGMFPTSEIAFVVIQTGQNAGIFKESLYSLILCIVVSSMILGPVIDSLTGPVYTLFARLGWGWMKAPADNISIPLPELRDHVIIAGGGVIARSIAKLFTNLQLPYLIIESDHTSFEENKRLGLQSIFGNPQQDVILTASGIADANILLLAADGIEDNLNTIRRARQLNPKIKIVARAESEQEVDQLHKLDIYEIVQPKFEAGLELTRQALLSMQVPPVEIQNYLDEVRFDRYKPLMDGSKDFSTVEKMRSFAGLVALNWINIPADSIFAGKTIAGSGIRAKYGVSVVGILRDGKFTSNPGPDQQLEPKDILAVIGTAASQAAFGRAAGKGPSPSPAAAKQ